MRTATLVACAASFAAAAAMGVLACVGEDPSPVSDGDGGAQKSPGSEGAACVDHTCLAGLVCSASDLCVRLDDAAGPGPTQDAAGDAATPDGGGAADAGPTCAANCQGCCSGTTCITAETDSTCGSNANACVTCTGDTHCDTALTPHACRYCVLEGGTCGNTNACCSGVPCVGGFCKYP